LAIAAVDNRREELDEACKPKLITFMDQDNLILEPDEHGNYVPSGDAFKRVKATEIEGINDRVPERIRRLREKPESFVGEPIYKCFARIADDADEDFDYTDFPSGVPTCTTAVQGSAVARCRALPRGAWRRGPEMSGIFRRPSRNFRFQNACRSCAHAHRTINAA
jgi:hypothetical protein